MFFSKLALIFVIENKLISVGLFSLIRSSLKCPALFQVEIFFIIPPSIWAKLGPSPNNLLQIEAELSDLKTVEAGILVDLMLSYRDDSAWMFETTADDLERVICTWKGRKDVTLLNKVYEVLRKKQAGLKQKDDQLS